MVGYTTFAVVLLALLTTLDTGVVFMSSTIAEVLRRQGKKTVRSAYVPSAGVIMTSMLVGLFIYHSQYELATVLFILGVYRVNLSISARRAASLPTISEVKSEIENQKEESHG
jgi:hypothetical protein